jgi:hypothetical protein
MSGPSGHENDYRYAWWTDYVASGLGGILSGVDVAVPLMRDQRGCSRLYFGYPKPSLLLTFTWFNTAGEGNEGVTKTGFRGFCFRMHPFFHILAVSAGMPADWNSVARIGASRISALRFPVVRSRFRSSEVHGVGNEKPDPVRVQ